MGKAGSTLNSTPSFIQAKSVKTLEYGREKNIPLCLSNKPARLERASSASNSKVARFIENTIVVWLDGSLDKITESNKGLLSQFNRIANIVRPFFNLEECYNFITSIQQEKIFFVVSGSLGPQMSPRLENLDQVHQIYLFCGNKANHEQWTKQYKKIRSIHTKIKELCETIKYDINQYDKALTSISILPVSAMDTLTESDKEFIYLQMIKRTLLEITTDKKFRQEYINFARPFYANNETQLHIIDTFDENYGIHSPIWWYTRKCNLYYMLRKAFMMRDFEIMYKLSFFIRDLNRDIRKSHSQTHNHQHSPIAVFRAASITRDQLEKLEKSQGGVIAFDDFLTTTLEQNVALKFANTIRTDPNAISVVYRIDIDPITSPIPYIALNNLSYLSNTDGQILFSMNTIFRIEKLERAQDRLYEVSLAAVSKKDEEIKHIMEYMEEVTLGLTGWYKLCKLLIDRKQEDLAERIYNYCYGLTQDNNREERAFIHHELGYLNELKNDLPAAINHYKHALEIHLKHLEPVHPILLSTHVNLGDTLLKQGDFHGAIQQYQLAMNIDKQDEPNIPRQYINIAQVYQKQGKYNEAQQNYDKAVQILLQEFPSSKGVLADAYHHMGQMYYLMKDYSKALINYEKTLEIDQKILSSNNPKFGTTYYNLATVHEALKAHKKAIQYAEKALVVAESVYGKNNSETKSYINYLTQLQQNP